MKLPWCIWPRLSLPGCGGGRAGPGWHRVCSESLFDLKCPEGRKGRMVGKVKFSLFDVVGQLLSVLKPDPLCKRDTVDPNATPARELKPWGRTEGARTCLHRPFRWQSLSLFHAGLFRVPWASYRSGTERPSAQD